MEKPKSGRKQGKHTIPALIMPVSTRPTGTVPIPPYRTVVRQKIWQNLGSLQVGKIVTEGSKCPSNVLNEADDDISIDVQSCRHPEVGDEVACRWDGLGGPVSSQKCGDVIRPNESHNSIDGLEQSLSCDLALCVFLPTFVPGAVGRGFDHVVTVEAL